MDETRATPQVPGYTLGERLGVGGNGAVWQAIRERDHACMAVKIVAGDRPDEVRDGIGADLVDEHLVRVHELVPLAHARTAVVMDLMAGGSLRAVVAARGRLSPGECVTVLAPLASALGRLHRRGIVHGDISPDNVLFDLRGRPHLSDLGASHALGDAPRDVLGTDGFVASEVLLGHDPGPASDVFGLAALGWFCLLGEEPDLAQVRETLADALVGAGDHDLIPTALVACLDSALDGHPETRPDADAFAVAVYESAEPEPLQITKGTDVTSGLTRRIRSAMKGARPDEPGPARRGQRRAARRRPSVRTAGARRWLARSAGLGLTIAFVALLVVAVTLLIRPTSTASARTTANVSTKGAVTSPVEPTPSSAASPSTTSPVTNRTPGVDDVRGLVQALSNARARAWSDLEATEWGSLSAPGSPAAAADAADRASLRAAGERAHNLSMTVRTAEWAGGAPDAATPTDTLRIRATIDVSAHTMVSAQGERAVPAVPGTAPVELELRWVDGTWRVWEVSS